jgi:hypothetical protein
MLLLYFLLLPLHITQEGQQHIDLYGYPFCHQIFPIKERWVVPLLVFQFEFFFLHIGKPINISTFFCHQLQMANLKNTCSFSIHSKVVGRGGR